MSAVTLFQAGSIACRYPVESKKPWQPRCCGEPAKKLFGYCERHHAACFVPAPKRRANTTDRTFPEIYAVHKEMISDEASA